MTDEHVVLDASALVDLLVAGQLGPAIEARIGGCVLHAPAHLDAEALSALGRLHRAGVLEAAAVGVHLDALAAAPIERHALGALLAGAWGRREELRLADALYVELASALGVRLVTTDARLGRASAVAEVVVA